MTSNRVKRGRTHRVSPELVPLPQHEVLHRLRGELEARHRELIHRYSAQYPSCYEPRIDQLDNLPRMRIDHANDFCNKTAPIYIYKTADTDPTELLLTDIRHGLAQAVAVMIDGKNYDRNIREGLTGVGRTQVCIIRTGVEDGLSASITFDFIADKTAGSIMGEGKRVKVVRTTLDIAYSFLTDSERREVAAFGVRPDPRESIGGFRTGYLTDPPIVLRDARKQGWKEDSLPVPSSQWVDTDKYPEWTGWGADFDSRGMNELENRERRRLKRMCDESYM